MQGKMPELKAIVQYTGTIVKQHQDVYDVSFNKPLYPHVSDVVVYCNVTAAVESIYGTWYWYDNQRD